MKKRGINIAALAIACVFVVTIIVFAACLYSDYNAGLKSAGAKFEKLSSRTAEASGIYSSGSKEFLSLFNSAVGSPAAYESILLEVDGKEAYSYPDSRDQQTSAFVKLFSTRIVGSDGADIRLSANIYTVPPAIIFYRAKIAFIVILAGTLAAGVLLMYLYLGEGQAQDSVDFKDQTIKDDFGESLLDEDEAEAETEPEREEPAPEEPAQSQEQDLEQEQSSSQAAPDHEAADEPKAQEEKVDFNPLENAYQEQANAAPSEEQGLFSPASGFGWESYLNARLESELVRAASSEQDLSLAIIKIPGMTKDSPYYGNVCQVLQEFFQFKDFIFEYKDDGFATIVQNKDVDQTLQSAEILHSNICGALSAAGEKSKPQIGISSRSLRLISAERLKNEAEQALLHAAEDPSSPIIAFRVNPEKYRKYISGQPEEGAENL